MPPPRLRGVAYCDPTVKPVAVQLSAALRLPTAESASHATWMVSAKVIPSMLHALPCSVHAYGTIAPRPGQT